MKKCIIFLLIFVAVHLQAQNNDFTYHDTETDDNDSTEVDSLSNDSISNAANALPWPQNVRARLTRLLQDDMFQTSQVGLQVYDLSADSILFSYNEKQTMRPASTMKMITAVAAIDKLGGGYQFRTSLYYSGGIINHTLKGNIYCVGGFDPRFNSDDMNAFIESIHRMGVDSILGNLVMDKSMKDDNLMGEGWCWDDDNPVLSPLVYGRKDQFDERFRQELKDAGIVFVYNDSISRSVSGEKNHLCTRFHTIDQILMKMMKESDNLYAESLYYQLAAASGNRPAKATDARNYIKQMVRKFGLDPSRYYFADGCGLSLYNYVSPELEVAFLRYAYANSNIYLHLYPSLPVAGQNGTLRHRMRNSFTSGNVHAKTGTVTGVSTLAGYCTASNGHVLCFSIMNQGLMHERNGRSFQDRVCHALCQP